MSIEDNKVVTAAVVERVMNQGDLAAVDEYYAAGYIEHDPFPLRSILAWRGSGS
jgi:hypothetical protein